MLVALPAPPPTSRPKDDLSASTPPAKAPPAPPPLLVRDPLPPPKLLPSSSPLLPALPPFLHWLLATAPPPLRDAPPLSSPSPSTPLPSPDAVSRPPPCKSSSKPSAPAAAAGSDDAAGDIGGAGGRACGCGGCEYYPCYRHAQNLEKHDRAQDKRFSEQTGQQWCPEGMAAGVEAVSASVPLSCAQSDEHNNTQGAGRRVSKQERASTSLSNPTRRPCLERGVTGAYKAKGMHVCLTLLLISMVNWNAQSLGHTHTHLPQPGGCASPKRLARKQAASGKWEPGGAGAASEAPCTLAPESGGGTPKVGGVSVAGPTTKPEAPCTLVPESGGGAPEVGNSTGPCAGVCGCCSRAPPGCAAGAAPCALAWA
eukprot:1137051-Pelagomonas_calceolata.AAC.3